MADREPGERDRLADELVTEYGLLDVAVQAAQRAGIEGWEQQVAYCLVMLAEKHDSSTTPLPEQLAAWAEAIAVNLRRWGSTYEAIQDEADRFEIETLRRMIRVPRSDDVVDVLADYVAGILAGAPRLSEMSLRNVSEAASGDYVFQGELPHWVAAIVRRRRPRDTDAIGDQEPRLASGDALAALERASETRRDVARALVISVAGLAETRGILAAAIQRAENLETELAARTPANADALRALRQVRAELAHVAEGLRREQRGLPWMLAYVALALRKAEKLQRIAILSLRVARLERAVIDHLAATMRGILDDETQPPPALVAKVRAATAHGVPAARARALEELRAAPERRPGAVAQVRQRLDELPPVVADVAAIAVLESSDTHNVDVHRSRVAAEVDAVDRWLGRAFRRYAMRPTP